MLPVGKKKRHFTRKLRQRHAGQAVKMMQKTLALFASPKDNAVEMQHNKQ
ncbi:hypothetical protein HMPREF9120_01737 [Neisseria sp. oral taxon 020 str. F0370]|nr:hypothetical protein HMPREF9120_01737 [Neisseria sp. oral taxon 020 str. F0370]